MFGRVHRIIDNARNLNSDAICEFIMEADYFKEKIIFKNQDQLQAGMGADGNSLPRYVDDPYFTSYAEAIRYQNWKKAISPNSAKPEEVMDFFINGWFQSQLVVKAYPDKVTITSADPLDIGDSAQDKTGGQALGLNETSKAEILPEIQKSYLTLVKQAIRA